MASSKNYYSLDYYVSKYGTVLDTPDALSHKQLGYIGLDKVTSQRGLESDEAVNSRWYEMCKRKTFILEIGMFYDDDGSEYYVAFDTLNGDMEFSTLEATVTFLKLTYPLRRGQRWVSDNPRPTNIALKWIDEEDDSDDF